MSELAIDMDNNFLSPFLKSFANIQEDDGQSQFVQSAIDGLNLHSGPCVLTQSLTSGITNSSYVNHPQRASISTKASPPVLPHTPQLKTIQPSKESSIMSSNTIFRHIAYGSLSPRRSPSHRPEMKPHRKLGCRDGSLKPKTARHAREMRAFGCCWPCRFSKVTVSLSLYSGDSAHI